ncbi:MAG TPA: ATP-binding protein [Verrucomicrobiae bacterium]|nr:ATP-binding protein [Verrucomicrobiae bacterium]
MTMKWGGKKTDRVMPYILSLMLVAAAFLAGWIAYAKAFLITTDLIIFYLLGVVIIALKWGRGPAIASSIASVLAFDYLFIPPQFSFATFSQHDFVTLAGFLIVGITISTLTTRLRRSLMKTQQMELLREKEKLYSTLLNSISHDLKTPLSSITAALGNLMHHNMDLDESSRRQLITTANAEAGRLSQLVENLLDMTKVEGGILELTRKPCDLSDLIGVALQQLSRGEEGYRVRVLLPDELPEACVDYDLMLKVLVNVIDNALKYSPRGSLVLLEIKTSMQSVRIEISDEGPGIPERELHRIFDKFYRGERTQKIPGTGLGLSICQGIVEAHQGKIWAENLPEKGTKMIVELPFCIEKPHA